MTADTLLKATGLQKHFGGIRALGGLDLDFHRGEIHALLGENGAGKSTFIKILAGVYSLTAGKIEWDGKDATAHLRQLPIGFIHQDLGVFDELSVSENIALVSSFPTRGGLIDWKAVREKAAETLQFLGGEILPDAKVGDLSLSEKSIVAIARALALNADLLVLDEPTAALAEPDVIKLHAVLQKVAARGTAVIYVTHRLDEVFRIAHRVSVLRDGKRVATDVLTNITPEELVHAIIGRKLEQLVMELPEIGSEPVLTAREVVSKAVGPATLTVFRKECLGMVGLRGAGHDTIGRALFGASAVTSGQIMISGEVAHFRTPQEATALRIGFVSSKRREEQLAPSLTARENLFINPFLQGKKPYRTYSNRSESGEAKNILQRLSMRPPNPELGVSSFSGGNQQKVVLSRWLDGQCDVLILEEPTIGVDVGSKAEIYALIEKAMGRGLAVILISSDLEEVSRICHRALVFDRGRISGELSRSELSVDKLTAAVAGGGMALQRHPDRGFIVSTLDVTPPELA